jgi:hypothetical protein
MEKSSQIARKIVPLRHFFPLNVVPLIEVILYIKADLGDENKVKMPGVLTPRTTGYCLVLGCEKSDGQDPFPSCT